MPLNDFDGAVFLENTCVYANGPQFFHCELMRPIGINQTGQLGNFRVVLFYRFLGIGVKLPYPKKFAGWPQKYPKKNLSETRLPVKFVAKLPSGLGTVSGRK